MTLNEFKTQAGVDTLQFYKGANNTLYCPTSIGTLFLAKDYKKSSKVQTVMAGFDDKGRKVYRLCNTAVAMAL
jgi:hypothetical protein